MSGKEGIEKKDSNYLIIFSDKIETLPKNAIYEYIFKKLKERLDMEMIKSK